MGAADRVRDRALARPRSGGGGNGFVRRRAQGRCRIKSWGPAVLDAGLEASITIKRTARETSRPLRLTLRLHSRTRTFAEHLRRGMMRARGPVASGKERTWQGPEMPEQH